MSVIISNYIRQFEYYKLLADKAIQQVPKADVFSLPSVNSNSLAVIMKHLASNMLSRWTDIFESDGEKPWRDRDQEFIIDQESFNDLSQYWESGWSRLFETLNSLEDTDLDKVIYIRNMGHTVREAIIRQLCHYSYHIGQIVYVSRFYCGESFVSLSIPLGDSRKYNAEKFSKDKTIKHFTEDL